MSVSLLLLVVLVVLLLTGPWYPYSRSWGYSPFGTILIVLLLLLLVLAFTGGLPHRAL